MTTFTFDKQAGARASTEASWNETHDGGLQLVFDDNHETWRGEQAVLRCFLLPLFYIYLPLGSLDGLEAFLRSIAWLGE